MGPDVQIVELSRTLEAGGDVYAVHYACEGFHDARDHPPGISVVSLSRIAGGDDVSFSVLDAHSAEDREVAMLQRFFDWLRAHPDSLLVHWNMDKSEYSFAALAGRHYHLTGTLTAPQHSRDRLYSLEDLIAHGHGEDYAPHPRLASLLAINGIVSRYSHTGPELGDLYRAGEHGALRLFSTERARQIGLLARLFVDGRLQSQNAGPGVRVGGVVIGSVDIVIHVAERLRSVNSELAHRHGGRPGWTLDDEYDHQDLLRGLLRLFFGDVRPEEWTPSYAGAASRVDFVLPEVGLAIELKSTRTGLDDKKVGEELLVDVERYQAHPDARRLVCLVYDSERRLRNPRGLERDLSEMKSGVPVRVRVLD